MTPHNNNPWAWLDDVVKRWPIIVCIIALITWLITLQLKQEAMAESINDIPPLKLQIQMLDKKIDVLGEKFDALTEALGYEIKLKAIKKEV